MSAARMAGGVVAQYRFRWVHGRCHGVRLRWTGCWPAVQCREEPDDRSVEAGGPM